MRLLFLVLSFTLIFACTKKEEDKTEAPLENVAERVDIKSDETGVVNNHDTLEVQADESSGIAEENDMCICTKEYSPVCGSNGVTYPNSCQAGCEKITEYTEGPCED